MRQKAMKEFAIITKNSPFLGQSGHKDDTILQHSLVTLSSLGYIFQTTKLSNLVAVVAVQYRNKWMCSRQSAQHSNPDSSVFLAIDG
jgi:hypothetical protein